MKLSQIRYLATAALVSGGLAITLAWASLLLGLSWSDGGVRYPGAERLATTHFRLATLPKGYISQSGAYQTADDARAVFGWYARHFDLGRANSRSAMGGCLALAKTDRQVFLQHAFAITICSQPSSTLVFVNQYLSVHW